MAVLPGFYALHEHFVPDRTFYTNSGQSRWAHEDNPGAQKKAATIRSQPFQITSDILLLSTVSGPEKHCQRFFLYNGGYLSIGIGSQMPQNGKNRFHLLRFSDHFGDLFGA